jgi:hypothetical protein
MQNSGATRRENADTHSPVIVREGGRSSIPETLMIETIGRGVLDTPHARGLCESRRFGDTGLFWHANRSLDGRE